MFKSKLIVVAVIIFAVVVGGGSIAAVHHNKQRENDRVQSAAAQEKKLAEWRVKVKAWNVQVAQNKQAQLAASSENATLQAEGVTELPHTGPQNLVLISASASLTGVVLYQLYLRRLNQA